MPAAKAKSLPRLLSAVVCLHIGACELVLGGIPDDNVPPEADQEPADNEPGGDLAADSPVRENPGDLSDFEPPADLPDAADADADASDDDTLPQAPTDTPNAPEAPLCSNAPSWWIDTDGDGYGAGTPVHACSRPTPQHVPRNGDCADDHPDVHPEQKAFFSEPYLRADHSESYDYNCSGSEEGDASLQLKTNCSTIVTGKCGGAGYAKQTQVRAGGNPYCGSTSIETCKPTLALVLCKSEPSTTDLPYRCR